MTAARRELGAITCLAVGLTTIVGSGIFALPSQLARGLGPMSFLAFLGAAVVVSLIGLMTAEAAGTTDRHGGTYAYVSDAFGKPLAFSIGWLSWLNNILSWATVSFALVILLDPGSRQTAQIIATVEIAAFGILNALGARPGAAVSNLLTIGKLVPLVLFVAIGFLAFDPGSFDGSREALSAAGAGGFAVAVYRCIFAAGGFENVGVIAGEVKDPQRVIPRAVILAIASSTILYALVQIAATSSVPGLATIVPAGEPGSMALPLAGEQAASSLGGAGFGDAIFWVIRIGAIVSMVGYCAGVALVAPRYLSAMAADGFIPHALVKTDRRGTPVIAVLGGTAIAITGVWTLDWLTLLDASVLLSLVQHAATTAAAWRLRAKVPASGRFVAPGGPIIPVLALASIVLLVVFAFAWAGPGDAVSSDHFRALGLVVASGLVVWGLTAVTRRG